MCIRCWRKRYGASQVIRKLLSVFGLGLVVVSTPAVAQQHEPYGKGSAANEIYELLFCDRSSGFQPKPGGEPTDWQLVLFGDGQDPVRVDELAKDDRAESRVRALAFNWLCMHGRETPKGLVLGVIIEVPLDHGLDVLAAYADGSVRYINQTGKMAIIEPGALPDASRQAKRLVELAKPVVAQIGPWEKARLPPPAKPNIRLTFIVSDGLYFGEGPFQVMQHDAAAGPLIQQGSQLLQQVADKANVMPAP